MSPRISAPKVYRCKANPDAYHPQEPCDCEGAADELLTVGDEVDVMSVQRPTEAVRRGRIRAIRQAEEFGKPVTVAQVGNVGTWLALWRLRKVARVAANGEAKCSGCTFTDTGSATYDHCPLHGLARASEGR